VASVNAGSVWPNHSATALIEAERDLRSLRRIRFLPDDGTQLDGGLPLFPGRAELAHGGAQASLEHVQASAWPLVGSRARSSHIRSCCVVGVVHREPPKELPAGSDRRRDEAVLDDDVSFLEQFGHRAVDAVMAALVDARCLHDLVASVPGHHGKPETSPSGTR